MNDTAEDDEHPLKKHRDGSGFFVFNEEDMKSMTEMSPKNLSTNRKRDDDSNLRLAHSAVGFKTGYDQNKGSVRFS